MQIRSLSGLFAVGAFAMALAACANADSSDDSMSATSGAGDEPRRCMFVRNIDNYHPIDRNHVVISDRSEDTYLLGTMHPGCWDIMSSASIALHTAPISLCEGQTATLMVAGERCFIRTLEAVGSVEAAESLVEMRAEEEDGTE